MMKKEQRLQSLDIFGGITITAMILVNTPGDWDHIYPPLEHSKWNGCTPTDLVLLSFLFIVGISIVYALQKKKIIDFIKLKSSGQRITGVKLLYSQLLHYVSPQNASLSAGCFVIFI